MTVQKTQCIRWLNLLLLASLLTGGNALSQEHTDRGFADFLLERGEYYRAITEYYRLLYASEDSVSKASILTSIGSSYYLGGDYEACISHEQQYRAVLGVLPSAQSRMFLLRGKSHYQLGQYQQAVDILAWSGIRKEDPAFGEARFAAGLARARLDDWDNAVASWREAESDSVWGPVTASMIARTESWEALPERSPVLAGVMSAVLPGAGYVYSGKPGTGVASLLLNGLLAWALYDGVRREQYGIAAAAGFLGMGWYIGNIFGSSRAAEDYNEAARSRFLDAQLGEAQCREYRSHR